jgi:hypothetical protein
MKSIVKMFFESIFNMRFFFYVVFTIQVFRSFPSLLIFWYKFRRALRRESTNSEICVFGGGKDVNSLKNLSILQRYSSIFHINLVRYKGRLSEDCKEYAFVGANLALELSCEQVKDLYANIDLIIANSQNKHILKECGYSNVIYFPPTLPIILTLLIVRIIGLKHDIYERRVPRTGFVFLSLIYCTLSPSKLGLLGISTKTTGVYENIDIDGAVIVQAEIDTLGMRTHCSISEEVCLTNALIKLFRKKILVEKITNA